MVVKKCFKCKQTKPLCDFYRHAEMADGHLNKCKECAKTDVRLNYIKKWEHYQEYEKQRSQDPHRKECVLSYQKKRRDKYPEKYKAHCAVNNALRDGRLTKQPCVICGSDKSEAHHYDYSKPLDIFWLCRKHHLQLHGKTTYEEKVA